VGAGDSNAEKGRARAVLVLSPKQRELQERDTRILEAARQLVLVHGYFGMTMDQIARESGFPKGTLYHRFDCKEDVLVALAVESIQRRQAMMQRAAEYAGRSRERLLGIAEAAVLFGRLNPQDVRIMHIATGPIREKASLSRLTTLADAERATLGILLRLLDEAVATGDLEPDGDATLKEIAEGGFALLEGGFRLIQDEIPQRILGLDDPFFRLWKYFNRTMDAYGWRPLFSEWDYEQSLADIRQRLFPAEAQALYGEGAWYGDHK
jgi:AcrR family transcriptional regulator